MEYNSHFFCRFNLFVSINNRMTTTTEAICGGVGLVLCVIAVLIIVSCVGGGFMKLMGKTCRVKCPDCDESFVVQNNRADTEETRQEVSRRIGVLAKKIDTLVIYMYNKKLPDSVISNRLAERWKRIRTSQDGLRETGVGETSAAYTVNKGDQIRICIRDAKSDKQFENENDTMFVMLHEIGHLMSKSYGHNLEFKKNFAYITKIAVELGLYKYTDYQTSPTNYCWTDISWPSY